MQSGVIEIAAWSQYPWLRAGFSTRQGGGTTAYSDGEPEQNLGWTPEDDPTIVAANRQGLVMAVGHQPSCKFDLVTMQQVHGSVVSVVERGVPLATAEGKAVLRADGLATCQTGLMLGVQTADCVPILIADTRTHAVGAFHAGWRGTLAQIAERGVATMQAHFGSRPGDLVAAIGPAIRQCCFAVGEEVRSAFVDKFAYGPELFHQQPDGQLFMDLHAANRQQLLDAGLAADAITVVAECTACARTEDARRRYFSYRAEKGVTGRMMSLIGITA